MSKLKNWQRITECAHCHKELERVPCDADKAVAAPDTRSRWCPSCKHLVVPRFTQTLTVAA